MSDSSIVILKDVSSFEAEVLKADLPVLVDFWAEWCGPCKALTPILDKLAPDYRGKVKICKLNVDENNITPAKYSVRGIPTLILFKNGEVAGTKVGVLKESELKKFLDSHLTEPT